MPVPLAKIVKDAGGVAIMRNVAALGAVAGLAKFPLSYLTDSLKAQFAKKAPEIAEQNVAVIMISHNLVDVFQVADFINVLYLGQMVAEIETSKTTSDDVVGYITGSKTYGGAA